GGGGGEFTFSFGPDPSGTLQELVDRFNTEYEGQYTASLREMPADTGQYFDQVRTEFQAGGGDIDLIGGDVIWPAQFAANGYILDLSDRFTEEDRQAFLPGPVESNTYEGKVFGVPWFTDAGLLYYRQDLLEENGFSEPPRTWDELKEMARTVQQNSGTQYGFVFQGADYEGGVVNGVEYIYSAGGEVLDSNNPDTVVVDSPEAIEGLTIQRSMVEDGIAPQSVATYKEQETQTAFLNGDAVFARNWPYLYALVADPEQSQITPEQVGVAPLPTANDGEQSASGLGGWNFMINAASDPETQEAAYEFIRFATSEEQQRFRALEGSFLPALQSLYEDQEILDAIPVIALAPEALQNSKPRPVSPFYSDMSLEMGEQFNASLNGEVSPEEAAQTLQGSLEGIIQQGQTM
nr:ABC transporter substrate-binding protein [Rubrobacter sp.]